MGRDHIGPTAGDVLSNEFIDLYKKIKGKIFLQK